MKKPQTSETYNQMFESGGADGAYDLSYRRSPYFPMYKKVYELIRQYKLKDVLEVGCGTGLFARMLHDLDKTIRYRGFDFSSVALDKARKLFNANELFFQGDATDKNAYSERYEAIICTEVLEHLEDDLAVIDNWQTGLLCICSVPNYDSVYHTRFFRTEQDVLERYQEKIDIAEIKRVKKPVLNDLSWTNYFRELRWNRYKPKRLLEILGFGDFDHVGGWFVFVGKKI